MALNKTDIMLWTAINDLIRRNTGNRNQSRRLYETVLYSVSFEPDIVLGEGTRCTIELRLFAAHTESGWTTKYYDFDSEAEEVQDQKQISKAAPRQIMANSEEE